MRTPPSPIVSACCFRFAFAGGTGDIALAFGTIATSISDVAGVCCAIAEKIKRVQQLKPMREMILFTIVPPGPFQPFRSLPDYESPLSRSLSRLVHGFLPCAFIRIALCLAVEMGRPSQICSFRVNLLPHFQYPAIPHCRITVTSVSSILETVRYALRKSCWFVLWPSEPAYPCRRGRTASKSRGNSLFASRNRRGCTGESGCDTTILVDLSTGPESEHQSSNSLVSGPTTGFPFPHLALLWSISFYKPGSIC